MLSIGLGMALSACSAGTPASKKDSVTVYDAHNRQILTTTSQSKIKRVTNLTSQSDRSTVNGQLPTGLRVKYRYLLHQRAHDVNINLYVYANSRNVKMTQIPVLHTIVYQLSKQDYKKLSQPEAYLKGFCWWTMIEDNKKLTTANRQL